MSKYAIQKKKLYEEVMEQISRLIRSGEYRVGDRLPSLQELSDMFEVGKPTLREALSVLTATGVLEIRHGSGIFVRKLFDDQLYDVAAQLGRVEGEKLLYWLEYRRAIEVEAAGLAAKRRNEFDIRSIEEAQMYLEEDTAKGNIGATWDYEFHEKIALATHNPIFSQAVTTTADILQQFFELSRRQSLAMPSRKEIVTNEHREILDCIKRGQPLEAQRAMLRHIDNVEKKVKLLSGI
ncbi:MAG: FadR/GntR family transcriptional regulator [Desulfitobacterium hafniense]|nr:FadR/GntR family transcriptional regulator [Desulfitobacterium hafniense]